MKAKFWFYVASVNKDEGGWLFRYFWIFPLRHENLTDRERKLQHRISELWDELLKVYSDYLDAVHERKRLKAKVLDSPDSFKNTSDKFQMTDSLFPLRHKTVTPVDKDRWKKLEAIIIKGSNKPRTTLRQEQFKDAVDSRKKKSIKTTLDGKKLSYVEDGEKIDEKEYAPNPHGGSNNANSQKKGGDNNQKQQNKKSSGYNEHWHPG
jgi:hypothetical protein